MRKVYFVAAVDDKNGIAIGGKIPWNLPTDQKYFRNLLKDGPVLVGWNTFKANGFKPFGYGKNTVVTNRPGEYSEVKYTNNLPVYFKATKEDIWVAGGGQIFKQTFAYATHLYITKVEGDYGCNIFFPEYKKDFVLIDSQKPQIENGITFTFELWQRKK